MKPSDWQGARLPFTLPEPGSLMIWLSSLKPMVENTAFQGAQLLVFMTRMLDGDVDESTPISFPSILFSPF